jgi:hypothetical protein
MEENGFLVSLEQTALGTFIRESASYLAFPGVLTMHTIGLCLILGANIIITARLLGLASNLPVAPLKKLFPFMWLGLLLTILSGAGLVVAAATTRALNPILLVKVLMIVIVTPITLKLQETAFEQASASPVISQSTRTLAASQFILWLAVLVAGRLIAYSATILGQGY